MDDLRYTAKSIWAHELGYREFLEFIANFFLIKRFVIPNSEYGEISQLLSSEIFYVATFSLSENVFCTCYSWVNSCNVLLLLQLIQVQKKTLAWVPIRNVFSCMLKDVPSATRVTVLRLSVQPISSWQPVSHAHLRVQSTSCTIRSVSGPCVVGQCTRLCTSPFVL